MNEQNREPINEQYNPEQLRRADELMREKEIEAARDALNRLHATDQTTSAEDAAKLFKKMASEYPETSPLEEIKGPVSDEQARQTLNQVLKSAEETVDKYIQQGGDYNDMSAFLENALDPKNRQN